MSRAGVVELVDDGMDEDGLLVDGEGGVGGDGDPVVCVEEGKGGSVSSGVSFDFG